jgi:putative ABC transport system permease protein
MLQINWPLCIVVVATYTAVMLSVTWYCCRRSLKEVPAELIRPKAPTSGKKILLEYLPFWKHVGFLNKVMLRNVFRYRQRMFMMLVGIGGCTALLLTGFGIRDSIRNIAVDQFANVTTNDLTVYFSESQTQEQQDDFRAAMKNQADDVLFFYQISADIRFENATKEIYLVSGEEDIKNFMHFKQDGQDLGMPAVGEAFLSIGVAENLGIEVGDTVTIADEDMRTLTVTVSGIYHNSVYNYAIVDPATIEQQWGEAPSNQMAFVDVRDYCDHHEAAAEASKLDGVMNVVVTQDIAGSVNSMLGALDTVVVTIVICAGALAMTVLYNLTNINITERIREIATIKVLGFHANETAAYVFKENLLLSAMGVLCGMPGGWYLLKFVTSEIQVDMVYFQAALEPVSILLGVVLTMLAACLVDFLLYFKLEKINMAEALKSVE